MKSSPEERVYRYRLQESALRAYREMSCENRVGGVLDCSRFCPSGCFWFGVMSDGSVGLYGLNRCHRRSSCPVCSLGADVACLNEIQYAIWRARRDGLGVYLVTYTFSHCKADTLDELQRMYAWANEDLWRNGSYRRDLDMCLGYRGRITDYEVQLCGRNGYHPHRHELFFCDPDLELDFFEWVVSGHYLKALSKAGLSASEEIGVKVDGYQGVGDYITKMSAECTLGKHTKVSWGGGSMSPFECLRAWHETGDRYYAAWWCDYVCSVKGKRMLGWSRGLKDRFKVRRFVDEMSVDSVASHPLVVVPARDYGRVPVWKWREMSERMNSREFDDVCEELDRIRISYHVDGDGLQIYNEW